MFIGVELTEPILLLRCLMFDLAKSFDRYNLVSYQEIYNIVEGQGIVQGLWSRTLGSIHSAASYFWFGCGMPFIQIKSRWNSTKNSGGPMWVCAPHMQSNLPLTLFKKRVDNSNVCGASRASNWWMLLLSYICTLQAESLRLSLIIPLVLLYGIGWVGDAKPYTTGTPFRKRPNTLSQRWDRNPQPFTPDEVLRGAQLRLNYFGWNKIKFQLHHDQLILIKIIIQFSTKTNQFQ